MATSFLDTSAVVNRYVAETGSGWVRVLTNPALGNLCYIASITRVEVLAAFYQRVRMGTFTTAQAQLAESVFRGDLNSIYRTVGIQTAILDRAMRLLPLYPLRAYDALQLASALELRARRRARGLSLPTLVSADHTLSQAAAAEGLFVDDPNNHP